MHGISLTTITLQTIVCLLIVKGSLSVISHKQNACYKSNVILSCPHYTATKPGKLTWRFYDKTTSKWTQIAKIRNSISSLSSANTGLDGRLAIHSNGSLEIKSLKPDDETQFQCKVKQGKRKLHVINLNVTCGKTTLVRRQLCVEDDVVLECKAKHRTNPRKLNQVKWHKKNISGNDVSWSLLVSSSGSNAAVANGYTLHGNGSLLLRGGRDESVVSYKCDVTKNVLSQAKDRHIVVVKNVKCQSANIKTSKGRLAPTTSSV